jgi:serine/threonine protein kinase
VIGGARSGTFRDVHPSGPSSSGPAGPPEAPGADDTAAGGATASYSGNEPMVSPLRGAPVDRYLIVDELGAGGMGVVYRAYDPDLGRLIALKLVRAGASSRATVRLVREARAIARLAHPNVVNVHDVGELDAGQVFIAMELVEGQRLRDWLSAPRLLREIVDVFLQAARGLDAAHEAGLVHRDFKPDNVLVGADGRVRVVDFGLAREWRDEESDEESDDDLDEAPTAVLAEGTRTRDAGDSTGDLARSITPTGAAVGTPRYMAPEQHQGKDCDARADQFAWAVAFYEALAHQRPFQGAGKDLRRHVVAGKLRPVPDAAGVPAWLARLVERALAADPGAHRRAHRRP